MQHYGVITFFLHALRYGARLSLPGAYLLLALAGFDPHLRSCCAHRQPRSSNMAKLPWQDLIVPFLLQTEDFESLGAGNDLFGSYEEQGLVYGMF